MHLWRRQLVVSMQYKPSTTCPIQTSLLLAIFSKVWVMSQILQRSTEKGTSSTGFCKRDEGSASNCKFEFVTELLLVLSENVPGSDVVFSSELCVSTAENNEYRLRRSEREHTIGFKMPRDGHNYIALTPQTFREFTWKWIGCVSDRSIIYALLPYSPFASFRPDFPLEKINDSDEELPSTIRGTCSSDLRAEMGQANIIMAPHTL